MNDKFPNLPTLDIRDIIQPRSYAPNIPIPFTQTDEFQQIIDERNRVIESDRKIQKNIEENTKRIADNTDWLCQSVNLIRINSEKQTELLQILSDVFALANSTNEYEAESKLKEILDSIQGFKENYELIMFVKKMGTALIKFVFTGEVDLPE